MKNIKSLHAALSAAIFALTLCACDQHVVTQSKVFDDGSIERTIVLSEVDSTAEKVNAFGASAAKGWDVKVTPSKKHTEKNEKKLIITFRKKYSNVADANGESEGVDSVLHIRSSLEKNFRWFYTYTSYRDTFQSINRFKQLPMTAFFAKEDLDFIERLPSHGTRVSKADSIFLDQLMNKIYDQYLPRALFEDHYQIFVAAAKKNGIENRWLDSLAKRKDEMFRILMEDDDLGEKPFMTTLARRMYSDFPMTAFAAEYEKNANPAKQNLRFMSEVASYDKFMHVIDLSGDITSHNADSVSGSSLFFKPVALKFMLDDHVMYAESRRINYWAFILSALIVVVTIVLFVRTK